MLRYLPVQWKERNLGHVRRYDCAFIDDGPPLESPVANLRRYDFFIKQNMRVNNYMCGANIHDNPQQRPGRRRSSLY